MHIARRNKMHLPSNMFEVGHMNKIQTHTVAYRMRWQINDCTGLLTSISGSLLYPAHALVSHRTFGWQLCKFHRCVRWHEAKASTQHRPTAVKIFGQRWIPCVWIFIAYFMYASPYPGKNCEKTISLGHILSLVNYHKRIEYDFIPFRYSMFLN